MAKKIVPSKTKTYKKTRAKIFEHMDKNSTIWVKNSRWYVGITNDEDRRKKEHEIKNNAECRFWNCWNMRTKRLARALESALHKQGLLDKDSPGNIKESTKHIYIYKKRPTIID